MINRFEVVVSDEWPQIKLVLTTASGARVEKRMHDIALTEFEPFVLNLLRAGVRDIIQRRKRSQQ